MSQLLQERCSKQAVRGTALEEPLHLRHSKTSVRPPPLRMLSRPGHSRECAPGSISRQWSAARAVASHRPGGNDRSDGRPDHRSPAKRPDGEDPRQGHPARDGGAIAPAWSGFPVPAACQGPSGAAGSRAAEAPHRGVRARVLLASARPLPRRPLDAGLEPVLLGAEVRAESRAGPPGEAGASPPRMAGDHGLGVPDTQSPGGRLAQGGQAARRRLDSFLRCSHLGDGS
jgi:hypothetical protein